MSRVKVGDSSINYQLQAHGSGFSLHLGERVVPVTVKTHTDGSLLLHVGGISYRARVEGNEVWVDGRVREVQVEAQAQATRTATQAAPSRRAPSGTPTMPGVISKIHVQAGATVALGDALISMTAMKMEQVIRAAQAGVIKEILVQVGQSVKQGQTLVSWEAI